MRITTFFRRTLGIPGIVVLSVILGTGEAVLRVRPPWRKPRCSRCGKQAPGYDRLAERRWRHIAFGRWPLWLCCELRRVECPSCGVCVEKVPWADPDSRFTYEFEELAAYLAQITDKTNAATLLGIAWRSIDSIVERVVARRLDGKRLDDLRIIGVDEFSYRKRHRYLTIVVDHERRRVVWAKEGKSGDVLLDFFKELGPERCKRIDTVTLDMSKGYLWAVEEAVPHAKTVFDRFHVQQLASQAVDEVRRSTVRELQARGEKEAAKAVKGMRFVLLKRSRELKPEDQIRLSDLQRVNKGLFRAFLLYQTLAEALDCREPAVAERELRSWLGWASRSKLGPFVRVAKTIRRHFDGVLAYVKTRLTNALAEGINNRLRMIAHRAFGFRSPQALISMLFLACGGIELNPPLP